MLRLSSHAAFVFVLCPHFPHCPGRFVSLSTHLQSQQHGVRAASIRRLCVVHSNACWTVSLHSVHESWCAIPCHVVAQALACRKGPVGLGWWGEKDRLWGRQTVLATDRWGLFSLDRRKWEAARQRENVWCQRGGSTAPATQRSAGHACS